VSSDVALEMGANVVREAIEWSAGRWTCGCLSQVRAAHTFDTRTITTRSDRGSPRGQKGHDVIELCFRDS